jgi:membrane-bound lytic murein transglycosylase B
MQPSAILAAVADFKNCIERTWPEAAKRHISRASFDRFTAGLEPDLRLMDLMDAQPEFTKAFWDYVDALVNDDRIQRGREILKQYEQTFAAVEKQYGVDRYTIVAIWGIETKFGTVAGDRPVIRSTATLACVGRRQAYFKDEFLAALEILHRGDVRRDAIHADGVQALRGGLRRRRAARRGGVGTGHRGVHRQPSGEGRMGLGRDLGL